MICGVEEHLRPSRPGQMTRRLGGATLVAQAISVFFGGLVAWQLDTAMGGDRGITLLWALGGVAVLCLFAAGALRSRAGIVLGWVCQVLTLASALILPAMLIVALLFGLLWWLCIKHGGRIDADRAAWAAAAGVAGPVTVDEPGPSTGQEG